MIKTASYLLLLLLPLCVLSCRDQGDTLEYLEILSIQPSPNSINVDKRSYVYLQFNNDVDFREGAKLLFRYVGDAAQFQLDYSCEECSPVNKSLSVGLGIWKPGRAVEVSVPSSLADINGRTLKQPLYFRFTIAQDLLPFRLVSSLPVNGDTVSIGQHFFSSLTLQFTDYPRFHASQIFITPTARIYEMGVSPAPGPSLYRHLTIDSLQPNIRYEILVPRALADFEGETLPQDYRIVFYTKP